MLKKIFISTALLWPVATLSLANDSGRVSLKDYTTTTPEEAHISSNYSNIYLHVLEGSKRNISIIEEKLQYANKFSQKTRRIKNHLKSIKNEL